MKGLKRITKGILLMVVFSLMLVGCSSNKTPDRVREEFWQAAKINYKIMDGYMNSKTREEYDEADKKLVENKDIFNKFVKMKYESPVEEKMETAYSNNFSLFIDYAAIIREYKEGDEKSEEDKAEMEKIKKEYKNNLKKLKKEIKVDILK